jgi:hypothetical protein
LNVLELVGSWRMQTAEAYGMLACVLAGREPGTINMHIYFAALQAKPGKSSELAPLVGATRDVIKAAGGEATAWVATTGAPIGAFGISLRVDGLAQLTELQQKFAASADYNAATSQMTDLLAGPTETFFNQVIGAAGDATAPSPFVSITRSTVMNGHLADALGWSTEVLEFIHGVTGLSGVLTTAAAGSFFDVSWIFSAASAAEGDAANDKLMAESDYIALIDRGGSFFVPGSAQRSTIMQLP